MLALMGYPGAGKSTLARWLADWIDKLQIVSRDVIRAAMFDPCFYTTAEEEAAFDATTSAIRTVIERGNSAVADGMCFFDVGPLEELRAITIDSGAIFIPIYCAISVETAIVRVEEDRRMARHSVAHRDAELVRTIAANFRALPADVITIEMENGTDTAGRELLACLKFRGT
ncbi:MAG: AAA family ATPase [Alphaproteobacteria bacterium]|nr:AAA family ATPase [Alphaproteobacteria bacterium]MBV9371026.1 AAA family ATPase [Alphaproteobacteria bacterium]MBV9901600.1 AAA family ATPase [Alphaproteobacteria bacterium]